MLDRDKEIVSLAKELTQAIVDTKQFKEGKIIMSFCKPDNEYSYTKVKVTTSTSGVCVCYKGDDTEYNDKFIELDRWEVKNG